MKKYTTNPVAAYFLTISDTTINSSKYRIEQFCKFVFNTKNFNNCNWSKITYIDVLSFIDHLKKQRLSVSSINVTLSVIKSVSMQAWQLGFICIDTYMKIKNIRNVKGSNISRGRALSVNEVKKLKLKLTVDDSVIAIRDYAIFALGVGAGLRRREISLLNITDIQKNKVVINGKGNKQRMVYLNNSTQDALEKWLKVRSSNNCAVFVGITKNSVNNRLSPLSIHRSIERIIKKSSCDSFTAHDLRRTFATTLLDMNADRFAIQRLLGHSSISTTEKYDKRGEKAAIEAIKLLPF